MISFVIIGKNEGWRLSKCLESVKNVAVTDNIKEYEIIYVDSQSSDDSVERVLGLGNVKIFKITGDCNAAIARNIGALEAKGSIFFFIDGDMEIQPGFLFKAMNSRGELIYPCVTGHFDNVFYDIDGIFISRVPATYKSVIPNNEQELIANGGVFIITRKIWEKVGGMKTKYRRSQDLDITIRLAKVGIKTIRIPFLIVLHHTVDYLNEKRMWKILFAGNEFYPALLFKCHLGNYKIVLRTIRNSYTSFILLILIFWAFISIKILGVFALLYIVILVGRVYKNSLRAASLENKFFYFFERILLQFARDIAFVLALLFFYPSEKRIEYKQLQ